MNNKITNIVVGLAIAVSLAIGVSAYNKTPDRVLGAQGVQGPRGEQGIPGTPGRDGKDGVTTTITKVVKEPVFGAVATLDNVDNPFTSIGGVKTYNYSQPITATSSVICSIKNPYNATSTLLSYSVSARSSSFIAAQTMSLSTSTSAYATSSQNYVLDYPAVAGVGFDMVWNPIATTSTRVMGLSDINGAATLLNVIKPNEYLNFRIATSSPGVGGAYTGFCKGHIQAIGQ